MENLIQNVFAVGGIQGVILFLLLSFDNKATTASKLLGIMCLLLAISFLVPFAYSISKTSETLVLLGWVMFLPASFGALNFLYYRHALTNAPFKWRETAYFIPFLMCYLLNLDWLLGPTEESLKSYFSGQHAPPWTVTVSIFILYIQAFIFNGVSVLFVYRYQKIAQHNLAHFNPDIFRWLWTFLFFSLCIWSLKLLAEVVEVKTYSHWADALIVVFIYSVGIAQWRNPSLFKVSRNTLLEDEIYGNKHAELKNSSVLDFETRKNLLDETERFMQKNKLYLDSNLTLTSLANSVGISPHYLSEVLNQQAGKNFYQYVNQYRIDYVVLKLQQSQNNKILDLAFEAGFSSKSTFNAVFKQIIGQTPSQYRQTLIKSNEQA